MQTIGNQEFCSDFLQGQKDCSEGVPHEDKGDAYNRGYSAQYELEQLQGNNYVSESN